MDEYTAQAMWDGSNTNIKSQCVILRYIKAYFGCTINIPMTVNDQKERFKNENVGKYHPVDPVSNTVTIKGEHIFYWTKLLIRSNYHIRGHRSLYRILYLLINRNQEGKLIHQMVILWILKYTISLSFLLVLQIVVPILIHSSIC